jgi:hypothetical protein
MIPGPPARFIGNCSRVGKMAARRNRDMHVFAQHLPHAPLWSDRRNHGGAGRRHHPAPIPPWVVDAALMTSYTRIAQIDGQGKQICIQPPARQRGRNGTDSIYITSQTKNSSSIRHPENMIEGPG